ncbi:MAG TPA: serine hydrolase domain-containing protein [Gaiellaceae bacterium]
MSTGSQQLTHGVGRQRPGSAWSLLAVAIVAIAVVAGVVVVGDRAGKAANPARPDLQRVLDGLVTGPGRIAPGATAYVSGPRGMWLGAAGVGDLRSGAPMPTDGRMRLESVSKIYTAALVLRLAQEGRLSLEDTVEQWLPGMLPYGDSITVRHLVTMRSGLIDTNDIAARPAFYLARVRDAGLRNRLTALSRRAEAHPAMTVSPVWWIRWAAWEPLLFEPGTSFHYSNIGYEVLGLIAARAAHASLGELYRTRIFVPLRLERTAYDPQGPIAGPHARGYTMTAGKGPVDATDRHVAIGAGGGIVSDAEETAAFLRALMKGRLLAPRNVAAMRGPNLWLGGERTGCGGAAYGWSGGGNGFKTNVWVNRDGSRVAVLLLNGRTAGKEQSSGDGDAAGALARLYCAG